MTRKIVSPRVVKGEKEDVSLTTSSRNSRPVGLKKIKKGRNGQSRAKVAGERRRGQPRAFCDTDFYGGVNLATAARSNIGIVKRRGQLTNDSDLSSPAYSGEPSTS